ncbi:MAG: Glycosyl transferase, family 2 [Candidatus Amesbacteria bacterium GW2011_GWA2_47_11b]|uniref:Glycosyl transferase, family 2 n=2 Tax=Candidatus Amesiibacteriota TaxID=1752730 RepID=A0A0G1RMY3_9BACT|nr:MAG: Glycosyl transferase, family 2 [Microgenomates group bacterium GW2011_GWC1_46_20]KKU58472.1 MAG: Glycosyl transferase, family 2 [Candidatus Amesbacteria bacterium GW2011_GWA2_47_11b]KKU84900.1 MAG: Glycosyl transferase, family 2 [Candidatus Amesbacteria bacterium GW2011_GWC2_47_8]
MDFKVSVVIPAFNGQRILAKNLPQVMKLEADEVIIVDDASTDNTVSFLSRNYSQIKLVRHFHNTRFPQTVNDGFRQATGDVVILLNQDASPHPDLLKNMLPHFKDKKLFSVTFNAQTQSWAKGSFKNGFLGFTNGEIDNKIHYSLWGSGGGAAFRKSIWKELGGLDTLFTPGYFEDLDIGFRAQKRGYLIIWEPKAIISHPHPESTYKKALPPNYLSLIKERNYLLVQWKNLDTFSLSQHLPALLARIFFHPGFIRPVLMALEHLPNIVRFRLSERSYLKVTDENLFAKFN